MEQPIEPDQSLASRDIGNWISLNGLEGAVLTAKRTLLELTKNCPDTKVGPEALAWRTEVREFVQRHT